MSYAESFNASWHIKVTDEEASGIRISGTGSGRIDFCIAKPFIAEVWQSRDSRLFELSMSLIPGSTEADARSVTQCFKEVLPTSHVTMVQPLLG